MENRKEHLLEMLVRAENIRGNKEKWYIKNLHLVLMMTELETTYNIPMMYDSTYEKENPDVIEVYRKISSMRRWDNVGQ